MYATTRLEQWRS